MRSACLSVCLSARVSQKPHVQIARNFQYMLPVAPVVLSSSDDIAIRYVLPVSWPTCHPSRRRMQSSAGGAVQALRIVGCAREGVTSWLVGANIHQYALCIVQGRHNRRIRWQQIAHRRRSVLSTCKVQKTVEITLF